MCTLKEPFENRPSHQKPCLIHVEKRHVPMHIHAIPYQLTKSVKKEHNSIIHILLNPDDLYGRQFLRFSEIILNPPIMISPRQPSGCNARVSTAWGAATKASEPKLKTWAKSAEHTRFLMDNPILMAKLHSVHWKIAFLDGQIQLFNSFSNTIVYPTFRWQNSTLFDGKTTLFDRQIHTEIHTHTDIYIYIRYIQYTHTHTHTYIHPVYMLVWFPFKTCQGRFWFPMAPW